ncbi:MAG TPA: hypothetical protein VIV15_07955 [Anaerolineales bacterium]
MFLDFVKQYKVAFFAALVAYVLGAFAYDTRVSAQAFLQAAIVFGFVALVIYFERKQVAERLTLIEPEFAVGDIQRFIAVVAGFVLVIAAAFGVTEFIAPSPNVQMLIQLVAAIILALYQRLAR